MRKTCMAAMALLLTATACNKVWDARPGHNNAAHDGGSTTTNDNQYALHFQVSNLLDPAGAATGHTLDSAKNVLNYLYYRLEEEGGKIHYIKQMRSDSTFGKITDSAPKGSYRVTLIASHDSLPSASDALGIEYFIHLAGGDLFGKAWMLKVEGSEDQTVKVGRLVSKVNVTITDPLPANAKELVLVEDRPALLNANVYPEALNQALDVIYGTSPTYLILDIPANAIGTSNFSRDVYMLVANEDKLGMRVDIQDEGHHLIASKAASNIKVSRNAITTLSGKLFDGGPVNNGLTVGYPVDTAFQHAGTE